jgi:hypothetical protein
MAPSLMRGCGRLGMVVKCAIELLRSLPSGPSLVEVFVALEAAATTFMNLHRIGRHSDDPIEDSIGNNQERRERKAKG